MADEQRAVVSAAEAARLTGIPVRSILRGIAAGTLPGVRAGKRTYVDVAVIERRLGRSA